MPEPSPVLLRADSSGGNPPRWKSVALVLNRESGVLAADGAADAAIKLAGRLRQFAAEVELHTVTGPEMDETLRRVCSGTAEVVIVGGGDGTVAAAAGLLAGTEKVMGILPLGTFNLAARDAGMPLNLEEAVEALAVAPVVEMDLLDVGGKPSLCVIVMGFYPALQMGKPEYHGNWLVKSWQSARLAFRSLATFPPLHLVLRHEGREEHCRSRIVLLANNEYEDLFGLIPRRQSLSGGYFTLYVSNHRTRGGLLKSFLSWTMGRWKEDRELTVRRATEMEIQSPRRRRLPVMRDGEIEQMEMPLRVRLRPGALKVLAPRGPDAVPEDEASQAGKGGRP